MRFSGNGRRGARDGIRFVAREEIRGSDGLARSCAAGRGAKNVNLSRGVALGREAIRVRFLGNYRCLPKNGTRPASGAANQNRVLRTRLYVVMRVEGLNAMVFVRKALSQVNSGWAAR